MTAHQCSTLLIRCMDFRLEQPIHDDFLEAQNLCGDCDVVAVAGGAQGLTRGTSTPECAELLAHIALAGKLHGVTTVILMNHADCGAYGGSVQFADPEEEEERHTQELAKARRTVLASNSALTVRTVYCDRTVDGEWTFEETPSS